jgi:[ribosomal protein S5]-alanine N-acetyltransferase
MTSELSSPRLRLIALSASQLALTLTDLPALGRELGFPVSQGMIDDKVPRAIKMKLAKMATADPGLHDWFTYWLIVVKESRIGVGMIGFKGAPNAEGATEVGYGIDEKHRNKGYMTEAVKTLCVWAFSHPGCRAVTATSVSNPASEKVLQKAGFVKTGRSEDSTDWILTRQS